MARIILIPYKMGSESCKLLKDKLVELGHKCLRVLTTSRTFRAKPSDIFLYYGGTQNRVELNTTINGTRNLAQNKLFAFRKLQEAGLSTVPWTDSRDTALQWMNEGKLVVGRRTLTGHSGQGIELYHQDDVQGDAQMENPCPLYTQYVKKTYECRIHVFNGEVIDAQIKRKARDHEDTNNHVRNIHTGWVYCRDNYTPDPISCNLAIAACRNLNLDFGAVDLIYNKHYNQFYILEVNTAPGLKETTLNNYANAIIKKVTTNV